MICMVSYIITKAEKHLKEKVKLILTAKHRNYKSVTINKIS